MFKKQLPIDIENFQEIIENNYYYADKTLLIKELLDNSNKAFLLTRPSGFGKTLALSMIQAFFEDTRDKNGKKVHTLHYFDGKGEYENYILPYIADNQ